jgi:hypothetical protein
MLVNDVSDITQLPLLHGRSSQSMQALARLYGESLTGMALKLIQFV